MASHYLTGLEFFLLQSKVDCDPARKAGAAPLDVSVALIPVAKAVGNIKNDSPELILPVE